MAVPDKKNPTTAVRVEKGDTLSAIAKANGLTLKEIRDLNPTLMNNPKYDKGNMIWSNTKVNIAPTAAKVVTPPKVETPVTPEPPKEEPPKEEPPKEEPPKEEPPKNPTPTPGTGANTDQGPATGGKGQPNPSPTQVDGGGATGGMPGGATGFSGGFTQADIDKAFAAGEAKATTTEADNKFAVKVAAKDKLINLFKAQGITDEAFATFISNNIMNDVSEAQTLIELYDQPAYKLRFPGMAKLRTKNRTITEAEYIGLENQMVQTLKFFDLPAGFYDDRATLGKIIENEVSPKEVQDRAQMAQDLARAADPNVRNALMDFYKVGEGAITAYFLNADKALPLLQKSAKAAEIAGIGKTYGFANFGMAEAEQLGVQDAYAKLSASDLTKAFGQASQLASTQSRLAYLDKDTYSDREALDAILEGDQKAILASTKRAQREQARFGGSSGLSASSLRTSSNI
jgi:outer membrane biosynthesis protein TonB